MRCEEHSASMVDMNVKTEDRRIAASVKEKLRKILVRCAMIFGLEAVALPKRPEVAKLKILKSS